MHYDSFSGPKNLRTLEKQYENIAIVFIMIKNQQAMEVMLAASKKYETNVWRL